MLSISGFHTKKALKEAIGSPPSFIETSIFGTEYNGQDGDYTIVGPSPYKRNWYATVSVKGGLITKVK